MAVRAIEVGGNDDIHELAIGTEAYTICGDATICATITQRWIRAGAGFAG